MAPDNIKNNIYVSQSERGAPHLFRELGVKKLKKNFSKVPATCHARNILFYLVHTWNAN